MSPELRIALLVALGLAIASLIAWVLWSTRQARRRAMADDSGLLADCLKMLVDSEPPGRPWSDRDLARMLTAEFGLPVRKRDVIQLRRLLHIPGPDQRNHQSPSG